MNKIIFFFVFILVSTNVFSKDVPSIDEDWSRNIQSFEAMATGSYQITDPIFLDLPDYQKHKRVDLQHIVENPSLLSFWKKDNSHNGFGAQSSNGGAYYTPATSVVPLYTSTEKLRKELGSTPGIHGARNTLYAYDFDRGMVILPYLTQRRFASISDQANLLYYSVDDYSLQASFSSLILESESIGNYGFAISFKSLIRRGNVLQNSIGDPLSKSTTAPNLNKTRFGVGMDLSFIWHQENVQIGFVWRDLGRTEPRLGAQPSNYHRYPLQPNNPVLGFGYLLPKFREITRSAFRVEYGEWFRDIGLIDKLSTSYELRFPVLLSFLVGVRGLSHVSSGIELRFPGIKVGLATYEDVVGSGKATRSLRYWMTELKGDF